MEEKKSISKLPAEAILRIIAKGVLVSGILLFLLLLLVFSMSYALDDFMLEGFLFAFYILLTAVTTWGLLSVICNISDKLTTKSAMDENWKKNFTLLVLAGDKVKAKLMLFSIILESVEFSKANSGGREEFHKSMVAEFYKTFGEYLKMVDIEDFDFESMKNI